MTTLHFETHSTSLDNEAGLASGHYDVALSETGRRQALEMGGRYRDHAPAGVYTSDLLRATESARLAFAGRGVPIHIDARLRECDYGDLTRHPAAGIDRLRFVEAPFPNGESYADVVKRVQRFLEELPRSGEILVIGHRATWYAFEHLLCGRRLEEVIAAAWSWQPGWVYRL